MKTEFILITNYEMEEEALPRSATMVQGTGRGEEGLK